MKFLLTTDTSCDVFRSELDAAQIPWVPLTYTVKGETFDDNFDSDAQYEAFYALLRSGVMPTTSQINSYAHEEFFTEQIQKSDGLPIVHLSLSSGLSNTVGSARVAAEEVERKIKDAKVYVVDTLAATQGHHMLLNEAKRLRDSGLDAEKASQALSEFTSRIQHWFMVDDLHHLKRGGRIGGASAAIGTLLNVKPVLTIAADGKLAIVKKLRGVRKVIDYYLETLAEHASELSPVEIIVVNGCAHENSAELKSRIEQAHPNIPVSIGWVGPVIGAHTGSGMFGVIFVGKKRER